MRRHKINRYRNFDNTNRTNEINTQKIKNIISEVVRDEIDKLRTSLIPTIETKIRYNIDQRLGLITNGDQLTTRGSNSFTISEDSTHGGKSFMFKYNGEPVALITSAGALYCRNIWINGINIIDTINKLFQQHEAGAMDYVKHSDLKNGTYEMNIEDIITNTITVHKSETIESTETKPLIINNTNEQWTADGRYSIISMNGTDAITQDRWNDSIIINGLLEAVDWGNSWQTMIYSYSHFNYFLHDNVSIVIGKEDMEGNSVEIEFVYNGDNDATNCLRLHFWDKTNEILQMFNNKIVTGVEEVDIFNTNRDATLKIGSNDGNARCFQVFYKYMYDTSNCYGLLGLQGHPGLKFWTDRLEALLPLTIDTINATTINATNGYFSSYISTDTASIHNIENISHAFFYDLEDMIIDFKKHYAFYNDRGRIIYTTSGTYNNTLSLDINKSHSIICRVYSDGGGTGNTDYFTTIKHVITLLDGDGKTTLKDLAATNGAFTTSLTLNGSSVLTDDSNYAKLNANNVFTGTTNTFKSATFLTNYIEELFANLSAGSETLFTFGQSTGMYQAGNLAYHLDSTLANSYIHLYLNGMSGLKIKADSVESVSPFVCPALTVNGNAIDAANIAYKNKANTWTQNQTIEGVLSLADYTGGNGRFLCFHCYDTNNADRYIYLQQYPSTTLNDNRLAFEIEGSNPLNIYNNRVDTTKRLTVYTASEPNAMGVYNTTANSNTYIWVGNSDANNDNRGTFGWCGAATASERCVAAWCRGTLIQKWYQTKTQIEKPLTITTTTTNGENLLDLVKPNLASGEWVRIRLGKEAGGDKVSGYMVYVYNTTLANRKLAFGHWNGNEPLAVFNDRVVVDGKLETTKTTPDNAFGSNMMTAILKLVYPVGSVYISMDASGVLPAAIAAIGTWSSIFSGYERQCIGSQVLYDQVIGNGTKTKVSLLGAYQYGLIDGVFSNITIPSGYHKEYRLTFQGSTGGSSIIRVFLNNIETSGVMTWSNDSFRNLGASNYFKESDITLETTMGYSNPGINLKYSNSNDTDYRIYNITIHGFIVSDTMTYKWKRTA